MRGIPRHTLLATTLLAAGLGCSDTTTAPGPEAGGPVSLAVVSGEGQSGIIGRELAQPLVVKVTDPATGRPLRRIVSFVVTKGGGTIFAGVAESNPNTGLAKDYWTLGRALGPGAHEVEVRSVDWYTGRKEVHARFTATGRPIPVGSVVVGPTGGTVHEQWDDLTLSATLTDEEGTDVTGEREVTWRSLDPDIALVDPATGVVTGVAAGLATIQATSEEASGTVTVTVTKAPVATLEVVAPPGPYYRLHRYDFGVIARDERGNVLTGRPIGMMAEFLNPFGGGYLHAAGTIDGGGVLTPTQATRWRVTAVVGSGPSFRSGSTEIDVTWAPVASLRVAAPAAIAPGSGGIVTVTALDDLGNPTRAAAAPTLASDDPNIVRVSGSPSAGDAAPTRYMAAVLAGAPGTVTLTATLGAATGSATVRVTNYPADAHEPNDAQESAASLGDLDVGQSVTVSGAFHGPGDTSDWFRVRALEVNRDGCGRLTPGAPQPYRVLVSRTGAPPAFTKWGLYLHTPTGVLRGKASVGTTDAVSFEFDGSCGTADSRELWIEVRREGGYAASEGYAIGVSFGGR